MVKMGIIKEIGGFLEDAGGKLQGYTECEICGRIIKEEGKWLCWECWQRNKDFIDKNRRK